MVFDSESGLVYTETVQKRCDCLRRSLQRNGKPKLPQDASSKHTPTLWDMALRRLLANTNKLSPEALENMPIALLERIWPKYQQYHKISLPLWKVMAQGQPLLVNGMPHYWDYHCKSCRRLPDIIQISDCHSYHWLTDLRLAAGYFSADDLFRIPNLRNLRSLVIQRGRVVQPSRECDVTDRVFRAWAYAAIEQGAFAKLVSIAIYSAFSGSAMVLEQLQHFPALEVFCVYDSYRLKQSTTLGEVYASFRRIEPVDCGCPGESRPINTPALQVTVGPGHPEHMPHDQHNVSFRRKSYGPTPASQLSSVCQPVPQVPTKRRKLKDGK